MGSIRPEDDLYQSIELQCTTEAQQIPNRVVLNIEEKKTMLPNEYPDEIAVSTYPALPIRIYERETKIEKLQDDFWLQKQLVLYNDDEEEKNHIVIRVHLYNKLDEFITIEERTVIAKETNTLSAHRHILHTLGVRISQYPTRMDIEIVEFD